MFRRGSKVTPYTREETERWLAWLAWQMTQHSQTVFHLERMQPTWLPERFRSKLKNFRWRTMRRVGLFVGLPVMLVGGLLVGLFAALAAGAGVCVGTIRTPREINEELRRRAAAAGIRVNGGRSLKDICEELGYRIAIGEQDPSVIQEVILWSLTGEEIISVETLHWSWLALEPWQWRHLLIAIPILSLPTGLGLGLFLWVAVGLATGVTVGLFAWVAETLFLGVVLISGGALASSEIETKMVPNQGIRRSARNALRTGPVGGLAGGLAGGLLAVLGYGLGFTPTIGWSAVLGFVLSFWLAAAMRYGGYTCLQHRTLRRLLVRHSVIPRHYVDFLDYAVERAFLHKIGGGYIFRHPLLQDYFSTLYQNTWRQSRGDRSHTEGKRLREVVNKGAAEA